MAEEKVALDDARLLYKTWMGMADYVENTNSVEDTGEAMTALKAVQDEYKYIRGRYPKYQEKVTDMMKKYKQKYVFVDMVEEDRKDKDILKSEFVADLRRVAYSIECYINAP